MLDGISVGAPSHLVDVALVEGLPTDAPSKRIALAQQLVREPTFAAAAGASCGPRAARYTRAALASASRMLRAGFTGLLAFARDEGAC